MSKEGGSYFRCRYSYLCETGFICSNGCALKDKKPCPYTDYMPKCPSYDRLAADSYSIVSDPSLYAEGRKCETISRCQWWFLTEKGGVCRNMLLTNCDKDCSFDDQTMCPAYTPIEKKEEPMSKFLSCQDDYTKDPLCQTYFADPVDADVKIFTNPMGEWHADPMGAIVATKNDVNNESAKKKEENKQMERCEWAIRNEGSYWHCNNKECSEFYGALCDGLLNCFYRKTDTPQHVEKSDYDVISHPSHYTEGRKYEPKDVIRDWGLNFNLGCVVKYISRAGRKDDILQDLEKARQYLDFEIEAITEERNDRH